MAKLKYLGASGVYQEPGNSYGFNPGEFSTEGRRSATWVDPDTNNTITFEGSKMTFKDGVLVSGKVEKILLEDFEHADIASFTGDYSGKKLGAVFENQGVDIFIEYASRGDDVMIGTTRDDYIEGHKGDDTMRGRAGDDRLWSGAGNDRMIGGVGSDEFSFELKGEYHPGDGHDTILDFDAKGGGSDQDYLHAAWEWVTDIHKAGKNTVIEFEDGGSLTLVDVKLADIGQDDFNIIP